MDCSRFRKALDRYENLTEIERQDIALHAEECAECRAEFEFFKSIIQTTASIPIPAPPEDLIEKINKRLDEEPRPASALRRAMTGVQASSKKYAAAAACLVVGLAVALSSDPVRQYLDHEDDDGVISSVVTDETPSHDESKDDGFEPSDAVPTAFAAQPTAASESGAAEAKTSAVPTAAAVPSVSATQAAPTPSRTARPSSNTARTSSSSYTPSSAGGSTSTGSGGRSSVSVTPQYGASSSQSGSATSSGDVSLSSGSAAARQSGGTESTSTSTAEAVPTQAVETPYASAQPTASVPVETSSVETALAEDKDEVTAYRLEDENYVLPRESYAEADQSPQPEATDESAIDGYSVNDSEYTVAMIESNDTIDELVINPDDSSKVFAVMANTNIEYTDGYYTSTMSEFYDFLDKLELKGVKFNYTLSYDGVGKVKFKVVSYK